MRKHHVFLFSALSVASLSAQQPVPSGVQPGAPVDAMATGTTATPAAAPAPIAVVPAPEVPRSDSAVPNSASSSTLAPTPVPIEAPAPIEPPTPPVATGDPVPIPPPLQATGEVGAPGAPLPPVAGAVPPVGPGIPVVPAGTVGVSGTGIASIATVAVAPGAHGVQDFQGDDIGQVLRLLARQAGINLVVSDQVTGTITMRLENMTPLEAINVIVTAKGLNMDQIKNVYFIKTAAEKQREPTESDNYTFSYATAEKVVPLLAAQIQCGVAPMFDQRTNTVYYREFKSNLANVKLFLETVDRPTQQVMIEARLVEVNANPTQSYGINWGGVVGSAGSPQKVSFGGSGLGTVALQPTNQTIHGIATKVPVVTDLPTVNTSTLENFVFGGSGAGFLKALNGQFAILNAPQLSLTMRLLNEDADAEFLANPRVVTANNLKANIKITRNQPVPQLNFNEQTATAVFGGFTDKEFGNTLSVTPTINKDDFVTMLVKPEISNKVGDSVFNFAGASVSSPIIDTRVLESTVLIKSGDTLAIGGLLQDENTKQTNKVPVMGDLPIIGYAFQEHLNVRTKRNLLVFVTPTIIKQGYGTGLEDQVSGLKHSGEEFADPNGWRNNAKGAVRLVPTSERQNSTDYPKPGMPPAPGTGTLYKISAPSREN